MLGSNKLITGIGLSIVMLSVPLQGLANQSNDKLSAKLQQKMAVANAGESITLFVYFKDKGTNLKHKLALAESTLSPKTLQRRIVNRGADKVVDFSDIPVEPTYVESIKSHSLKVRHVLKLLNAVSIEATPDQISKIASYDFVEKVTIVNSLKRDPDTPALTVQPEETQLKQAEATKAEYMLDYGASLTQNEQIRVPAAHDLGYSGDGVVIAMFDSGYNRMSHEGFSQINIAGTWDFVNNDADVGDGNDLGTSNHGTYTLSTIGGYSPGNLIGPAYGATFYLAKTENSDSEQQVEEDNWCAATEWAETNGAQIISSSLGYRTFDDGSGYTSAQMDGDTAVVTVCADAIAERGVVVVNSAGNRGSNPDANTLGAPSDGHFVIAVGAVTSTGERSSFSSVGPSGDGRIKPDVMAMGSSVRVIGVNSDTDYFNINGTSFSCPLTSGVAALVLEANPNLTAAQVRDILRDTADQATMPDSRYGYGLINAYAAVLAANGQFVPRATFSYSADSVNRTTVSFTSNATDSDGTITTYLWEFGDGNTSTAQSPTHTYASGAMYTVKLSVTDNDGLVGTSTQLIQVLQPVASSSSSGSGGWTMGFSLLIGGLLLMRKRN